VSNVDNKNALVTGANVFLLANFRRAGFANARKFACGGVFCIASADRDLE
jgi:hypothetical protein